MDGMDGMDSMDSMDGVDGSTRASWFALAALAIGACKGTPAPPLRVIGHACTRTIEIEHLADERARCARADLAAQGDVTGVRCDETSCEFTVRRWVKHRTVEARGTDTEPAWPAVELLAKTGDQLGIEREGARATSYTILVGDGTAAPRVCEVPEPTWRAWTDGTTLAAGRTDGGVDCATLTASPAKG